MKKTVLLFLCCYYSLFANSQDYPEIQKITTTSTLMEIDKVASTYDPSNLIDSSWKSWAENDSGSGIGTKIIFEFKKPFKFSKARNYASISIMNGFGNVKYYYQNNRVKEMNIYIDYYLNPIKITLRDNWNCQFFDLRTELSGRTVNKIIFEIISIYPGSKYNDTCLTEISIGPNWINIPADPYLAELEYAYYRDILKDTSRIRFSKDNNLEYYEEADIKFNRETPQWVFKPRTGNVYFSSECKPLRIVPTNLQNPEDLNNMEAYLKYKNLEFYIYENGKWNLASDDLRFSIVNKILDKNKGKNFAIQYTSVDYLDKEMFIYQPFELRYFNIEDNNEYQIDNYFFYFNGKEFLSYQNSKP